MNTEQMNTLVQMSALRNMFIADCVKMSAPFMVFPLAMWCAFTMPNHPQAYTEEEIKAHRESRK